MITCANNWRYAEIFNFGLNKKTETDVVHKFPSQLYICAF